MYYIPTDIINKICVLTGVHIKNKMIQGLGPVTQALLGTLFTWGLTALGAAMVIFLHGNQVNALQKKNKNILHYKKNLNLLIYIFVCFNK